MRASDDTAARTAQITAMLTAQAAALVAGDDDAFRKTLTADADYDMGGRSVAARGTRSSLVGPGKLEFWRPQIGWAGTWGGSPRTCGSSRTRTPR